MTTMKKGIIVLHQNTGQFDNFDLLLLQLEANPDTSKLLSDARKWLAQTFYSSPTTFASLRLLAGLSVTQLGIATGIPQAVISDYEHGLGKLEIKDASALAIQFGTTPEYLYRAFENMKTKNKEIQ